MTDQMWPLLLGIGAVLFIIIGGLAARERAAAREEKAIHAATVAMLIERESATGLGGLCIVLLVLWNVVAAVGLVAAPRILDSLVAGVVWLAVNQVLIAGATIGRRRRYVIVRSGESNEEIAR